MQHEELLKAVAAEEVKAGELNAFRHAVWTALVKAEPELARHILELFSNPGVHPRFHGHLREGRSRP